MLDPAQLSGIEGGPAPVPFTEGTLAWDPNSPFAIPGLLDEPTPEGEPFTEGSQSSEPAPAPAAESLPPPEPVLSEPTPAPRFDLDALLRDPIAAPQLQSELDRRSAGLYRADRERIMREIEAERAEEIRRETLEQQREEEARLEELALSNDLTPEAEEARDRLSNMRNLKRWQEQWDTELRPTIEQEVAARFDQQVEASFGSLYDTLAGQYSAGLSAIPEVAGDPAYSNLAFRDAGEWLRAVADKVRADTLAGLGPEQETRIEERARAIAAEETAALRARVQAGDHMPERPAGGAGQVFRNKLEWEQAYARGDADLRSLRASNPYEFERRFNGLPEAPLAY